MLHRQVVKEPSQKVKGAKFYQLPTVLISEVTQFLGYPYNYILRGVNRSLANTIKQQQWLPKRPLKLELVKIGLINSKRICLDVEFSETKDTLLCHIVHTEDSRISTRVLTLPELDHDECFPRDEISGLNCDSGNIVCATLKSGMLIVYDSKSLRENSIQCIGMSPGMEKKVWSIPLPETETSSRSCILGLHQLSADDLRDPNLAHLLVVHGCEIVFRGTRSESETTALEKLTNKSYQETRASLLDSGITSILGVCLHTDRLIMWSKSKDFVNVHIRSFVPPCSSELKVTTKIPNDVYCGHCAGPNMLIIWTISGMCFFYTLNGQYMNELDLSLSLLLDNDVSELPRRGKISPDGKFLVFWSNQNVVVYEIFYLR